MHPPPHKLRNHPRRKRLVDAKPGDGPRYLIDTCLVYVFVHQTGVDQELVADGLRERLCGRRGVLRSRRVQPAGGPSPRGG